MRLRSAAVMLGLALLGGCNGDYSGGTTADSAAPGSGQGGETAQFANTESFFDARVAPRMDFCRTCHVPGGVADTPEGERFILSANSGDDYANLFAAWQALGEGVEDNLLIIENADNSEPHSGGKNWPVGSDAHNDMVTLLSCWDDPAACVLGAVGEVVDQLPLLGSQRGGHIWGDYCADKPDDAELPVDPRTLVQPAVNDGKAVYFNIYAKDCHIDPELVGEKDHPKTCGEYRAAYASGEQLVLGNGAVGAGSLFAGTQPDGYAAIPSTVYNKVWQAWGLTQRPANFDELLAQRWGYSFTVVPNPYPLPGEDPNATDGGSGQLPTAFTQLRNEDGSWSGNIGLTCHSCHGGMAGLPSDGEGLGQTFYGGGSSPHDMGLMARDLGVAGQPLFGAASATGLFGKTRGTGNPINVQAIILMTADIRLNANTVPFFTAPTAGSEDAPAWWNMGHRPVKFYDGFLPMDADRSNLGLFLPFLDRKPIPSGQQEAQDWVRTHAQDAALWTWSQKSPQYPLEVDTVLAEQGAVLFHSKDLWADETENPTPRPPGGNGSCASCHGAYSPRYVNDPAYLETPELEGMASYLVPLEIIGTDPARANSNTDETSEYGRGNFYAYPETDGMEPEYDCGPQTREGLRGDRSPGYLAPPLYGLWSTAPYFHNGSVPNVEEVLDPSQRKPLWRRVSAPAPQGQQGVVMGYDTSLARAYDEKKMGWDYEALQCGTGTIPLLECLPGDEPQASPVQDLLSGLNGLIGLSWNVDLPPLSNAQAEARKIYNSFDHSQGNSGHEFTAVLTEAERRAIIEYLKTL